MDETTITAFFDELEKVGIAMPALNTLKLLKYPALMAGGAVGWDQLKKMKGRYDIGKAYEQQMAGRR